MQIPSYSNLTPVDIAQIRLCMVPEQFIEKLEFLETEFLMNQEVFELAFPVEFKKWKDDKKGS
jgi:hypothetical protein